MPSKRNILKIGCVLAALALGYMRGCSAYHKIAPGKETPKHSAPVARSGKTIDSVVAMSPQAKKQSAGQHMVQGNSLWQRGYLDEAVLEYTKAWRLDPHLKWLDNYRIFNNIRNDANDLRRQNNITYRIRDLAGQIQKQAMPEPVKQDLLGQLFNYSYSQFRHVGEKKQRVEVAPAYQIYQWKAKKPMLVSEHGRVFMDRHRGSYVKKGRIPPAYEYLITPAHYTEVLVIPMQFREIVVRDNIPEEEIQARYVAKK